MRRGCDHPGQKRKLIYGVCSESVESRSGAIQRLVEENFDRFIAIKAATFNVYEEMKLGPLAADNDYSSGSARVFEA